MIDHPQSLSPDQWQQRAKDALALAAQTPHGLGHQTAGSDHLSLRQLIWSQADEIIAMNARGIRYRTIAKHLNEAGIPISDALLKHYIYAYRKQNGISAAAKRHSAKSTAKELLKGISF